MEYAARPRVHTNCVLTSYENYIPLIEIPQKPSTTLCVLLVEVSRVFDWPCLIEREH